MTSLPSTGSRRALCGQAAGAGAVGHAPKMSSIVTSGSGHAGCCHLIALSSQTQDRNEIKTSAKVSSQLRSCTLSGQCRDIFKMLSRFENVEKY